jgi:hypothetical protein
MILSFLTQMNLLSAWRAHVLQTRSITLQLLQHLQVKAPFYRTVRHTKYFIERHMAKR